MKLWLYNNRIAVAWKSFPILAESWKSCEHWCVKLQILIDLSRDWKFENIAKSQGEKYCKIQNNYKSTGEGLLLRNFPNLRVVALRVVTGRCWYVLGCSQDYFIDMQMWPKHTNLRTPYHNCLNSVHKHEPKVEMASNWNWVVTFWIHVTNYVDLLGQLQIDQSCLWTNPITQ